MANSIIEVPESLLMPAESASFSGEFSLDELEAGPDVYTFDGPLSWSCFAQNTGDALLVSGSVSGVAKTACARCLDDFSLTISGDIEAYYLISKASAKPEDMDDDEFDFLPESHEIDVQPLAVAGMLVELPLVPLCKEDCLGLCAHCGANLNEGPCDCQNADDQDNSDDEFRMSDGRVSPFAVLKDLDLS